MNIETREIKDERDMTPAEKASPLWIPVRRKHVQKQPISDTDYARIVEANARRVAKNQRRIAAQQKTIAGLP